MTDDNQEVVIVTERFYPDMSSATGNYMTDLAVGLSERGVDVTVVTRALQGDGDEETAAELVAADPSIVRMPIPEVVESSLLRRLLNWVTFLGLAVPYLLVDRTARDRHVLFVSYPIIAPPLLWFVCRLRGWAYTYVVYDFYPDIAIEMGYLREGGIVHRVWQRLNESLIGDAENVIVLGPRMREYVIDSVERPLEASKVRIAHNWADGEFIVPRAKDDNWFSDEQDLRDRFALVYSGNIGEFHDLETVVRGAAVLEDDTRVLLIGEGDNRERIQQLADNLGVLGDTVNMLPYQPWEDIPYTLTAGDVSIVAIDETSEGLVVSSKLYSALATGQPVLVVASESDDEARLVKQFDAGKQVSPGDVEGFRAAVEDWRQNPELAREQGENARAAFEKHFTREQAVDRYYEILTA